MGVDPGFPKAGAKVIWDVVPTVLLGGKVFGRRSGRSDWMAGKVRGGRGRVRGGGGTAVSAML